MAVKPERTGWRDLGLSLRHREWGDVCAGTDIDFLFVEYDYGKPVALIEYKNEHAAVPDLSHANYKAMRALANKSDIPCYLCRYASDYTWFEVTALTPLAARLLRCDKKLLCERRYVKFLYYLRRQKLPEEIEATLIS